MNYILDLDDGNDSFDDDQIESLSEHFKFELNNLDVKDKPMPTEDKSKYQNTTEQLILNPYEVTFLNWHS